MNNYTNFDAGLQNVEIYVEKIMGIFYLLLGLKMLRVFLQTVCKIVGMCI